MSGQVTLSLESDAVRLVLLKDHRVVSWDSFPLPAPLAEADPSETGRQIRSFMQSRGLKTSRAVVDLCHTPLLARNLQLPKMSQRYVPQVVAKEVKESIPFSPEEVDIAWQAFPDGQGWQVLALCIPSDLLDRQAAVLKAAGLSVTLLYPKPLALIHAVGERQALLLNLEPDRTEISLVLQGRPRVFYQSSTRLDKEKRPEALRVLVAEVERILEFQESAGLGDSGPVVVVPTGRLADEEVVAALRHSGQREVRFFKPPLECPADFPASEYAINLGLALAARSPSRANALLPRINVWPVRHRPKPFPWPLAVFFTCLLALAAAALPLSQELAKKETEAVELLHQFTSLQRQMRQERLRRLEIGARRQELERTVALARQLDAQLQQLATKRSAMIQRLETVAAEAARDGIVLDSISYRASGFGMQVQAPGYDEVLKYAAHLKTSGLFQEVDLIEGRAGTKGASFKIGATYPEKTARAPPSASPTAEIPSPKGSLPLGTVGR